MTETESRLARVETKVDNITSLLQEIRDALPRQEERITRLEESCRDAIPQVWKTKEKVEHFEHFRSNVTWVSGAVWAVILIIIGTLVKRVFGGG